MNTKTNMGAQVAANKLTIEFPNTKILDMFTTWLSNSGEQDFFLFLEQELDQNVSFNYSKCFKAWGYNSIRDGQKLIRVEEI